MDIAKMKEGSRGLAVTYDLPPKLSNLLWLLMEHPYVDHEIMEASRAAMQISTPTKVAIQRLRTKLAKHGVEVKSNRTRGWWLDEDTKDGIRHRLGHAPRGNEQSVQAG